MFWIPRLVREIQEPGTAMMPLSGSVASGCCDYAQHDMGVLPHDVMALPHDVMALPHGVMALPHDVVVLSHDVVASLPDPLVPHGAYPDR